MGGFFFKILGLKRQMKKLKTQSCVDFSSSKGRIGIVCYCNNGGATPLSIAADHFVGTRNRKPSFGPRCQLVESPVVGLPIF